MCRYSIYWVNYHYLLDDVQQVTHAVLWINLLFLFCLSLFPLGTGWVGVRGITGFSVSLYAAISFLPAMVFSLLSRVLRSKRMVAAAQPVKEWTSLALYLCAIGMARRAPSVAMAMLVTVAMLWLVPPRRVYDSSRQRTR